MRLMVGTYWTFCVRLNTSWHLVIFAQRHGIETILNVQHGIACCVQTQLLDLIKTNKNGHSNMHVIEKYLIDLS